jgi:NitT/TauT family transport system ATP-binding protein
MSSEILSDTEIDEATAMADPQAFVEVRQVHKEFGRRGGEPLVVLDDVGLEARAGEFVVIIGPSGCGKSTLLSCIAGLTTFDGGSITIGGDPVLGPGEEAAVVFQHSSLLPWRTVQQNVAYGLELRRSASKAEVAQRVADAMELVGLTGFERHYPHEISGGMQQRANLARALVVDPQLILMDEPFGALDALTKETMQDELSNLIGQIDRTTIFITHDIQEAAFLGDRVLVMSARPGRIVEDITLPFERPRSRSLTETKDFDEVVGQLRRLLRHGEGSAVV